MQKIKKLFIVHYLILLGGCNIYFDYVERGYAVEAKTQLKSIYEASKLYISENGSPPLDIEEINDSNYLNIPQSILEKWDFEINIYLAWETPGKYIYGEIIATSLNAMPGGAGQVIIFDLDSEKFTGYGQRDDVSGYK